MYGGFSAPAGRGYVPSLPLYPAPAYAQSAGSQVSWASSPIVPMGSPRFIPQNVPVVPLSLPPAAGSPRQAPLQTSIGLPMDSHPASFSLKRMEERTEMFILSEMGRREKNEANTIYFIAKPSKFALTPLFSYKSGLAIYVTRPEGGAINGYKAVKLALTGKVIYPDSKAMNTLIQIAGDQDYGVYGSLKDSLGIEEGFVQPDLYEEFEGKVNILGVTYINEFSMRGVTEMKSAVPMSTLPGSPGLPLTTSVLAAATALPVIEQKTDKPITYSPGAGYFPSLKQKIVRVSIEGGPSGIATITDTSDGIYDFFNNLSDGKHKIDLYGRSGGYSPYVYVDGVDVTDKVGMIASYLTGIAYQDVIVSSIKFTPYAIPTIMIDVSVKQYVPAASPVPTEQKNDRSKTPVIQVTDNIMSGFGYTGAGIILAKDNELYNLILSSGISRNNIVLKYSDKYPDKIYLNDKDITTYERDLYIFYNIARQIFDNFTIAPATDYQPNIYITISRESPPAPVPVSVPTSPIQLPGAGVPSSLGSPIALMPVPGVASSSASPRSILVQPGTPRGSSPKSVWFPSTAT